MQFCARPGFDASTSHRGANLTDHTGESDVVKELPIVYFPGDDNGQAHQAMSISVARAAILGNREGPLVIIPAVSENRDRNERRVGTSS